MQSLRSERVNAPAHRVTREHMRRFRSSHSQSVLTTFDKLIEASAPQAMGRRLPYLRTGPEVVNYWGGSALPIAPPCERVETLASFKMRSTLGLLMPSSFETAFALSPAT